jgi:hypothetical protein
MSPPEPPKSPFAALPGWNAGGRFSHFLYVGRGQKNSGFNTIASRRRQAGDAGRFSEAGAIGLGWRYFHLCHQHGVAVRKEGQWFQNDICKWGIRAEIAFQKFVQRIFNVGYLHH